MAPDVGVAEIMGGTVNVGAAEAQSGTHVRNAGRSRWTMRRLAVAIGTVMLLCHRVAIADAPSVRAEGTGCVGIGNNYGDVHVHNNCPAPSAPGASSPSDGGRQALAPTSADRKRLTAILGPKAERLLKEGRYDEIERLVRAARDQEGPARLRAAQLDFLEARMRLLQNELSAALPLLRSAADLAPKNCVYRSWYAGTLLGLGRRREANQEIGTEQQFGACSPSMTSLESIQSRLVRSELLAINGDARKAGSLLRQTDGLVKRISEKAPEDMLQANCAFAAVVDDVLGDDKGFVHRSWERCEQVATKLSTTLLEQKSISLPFFYIQLASHYLRRADVARFHGTLEASIAYMRQLLRDNPGAPVNGMLAVTLGNLARHRSYCTLGPDDADRSKVDESLTLFEKHWRDDPGGLAAYAQALVRTWTLEPDDMKVRLARAMDVVQALRDRPDDPGAEFISGPFCDGLISLSQVARSTKSYDAALDLVKRADECVDRLGQAPTPYHHRLKAQVAFNEFNALVADHRWSDARKAIAAWHKAADALMDISHGTDYFSKATALASEASLRLSESKKADADVLYKAADKLLEEAHASDSDRSELKRTYGMFLGKELGDFKRAREQFDSVVAMDRAEATANRTIRNVGKWVLDSETQIWLAAALGDWDFATQGIASLTAALLKVVEGERAAWSTGCQTDDAMAWLELDRASLAAAVASLGITWEDPKNEQSVKELMHRLATDGAPWSWSPKTGEDVPPLVLVSAEYVRRKSDARSKAFVALFNSERTTALKNAEKPASAEKGGTAQQPKPQQTAQQPQPPKGSGR